jgi:glycogenin
MPLIKNGAYVTLVTSDSYVAGAGVLARSLQATGTKRQIWCLVANKNLSASSLEILRSIFDGVTEVDCIDSGDKANLALLGRPELGPTFTKLHLWSLIQFEKVVFLDADTLVLKNIDDLFEREEFSACADIGWPDCFNSGVFVATPNEETYQNLMKLAEKEGSFDGGDQGLLNAYFSDWSIGPSSRRIPFTYNLTINASYSYAPAYARFKNDVKVVHFIGTQKPWTYYRLSDGSVIPRGIGSDPNISNGGGNLEYVQMWWSVYDNLTKSLQNNNSLSFMPSGSIGSVGNQNEVIKCYPPSTISNDSTVSAFDSSSTAQFGVSDASDFASYRIKWNADVERYFKNGKMASSPSPTNADLSINNQQQFLVRDLRHQSHQTKKNNYRVLSGSDNDEIFYDGRYYSDDI